MAENSKFTVEKNDSNVMGKEVKNYSNYLSL